MNPMRMDNPPEVLVIDTVRSSGSGTCLNMLYCTINAEITILRIDDIK